MPRLTLRDVLAVAAQPLLLLAAVAVFVPTVWRGWEPGVATFLFQFAVLGLLLVLEFVIPYNPAWRPDRREWGHYAVYYVLTAAGGALGQNLVLLAVGAVANPYPVLPLWGEIPLALLLGSLASYGVHRAGHTYAWLWRLHGVHHVPDKVNVGNNSVNHVADVVISQGFVQLALALVGFSERAVFAVGLFVVAQGYFVHANVRVRLGPLNHVLAGPEQHRLHHSTDLAEAGHYGSDLSVWDRLFGTFTWHPGREPAAVGLADPRTFPATGRILTTLVHPWRRSAG
ncbi:sterol desaturase family protein [Streptomyces sp. NBC_01317]|uniref:sterol desaturase family protein n=1 Tax=Streptomyces sp. NBC_01317 TaxID=2903822 RepID=UPI002E163634|nr:sterol desaturase family protein [Streptomyces sp. NBC_01317]